MSARGERDGSGLLVASSPHGNTVVIKDLKVLKKKRSSNEKDSREASEEEEEWMELRERYRTGAGFRGR